LSTSENTENTELLAQMMITMSFSSSDLGMFKDSTHEFNKLIYCAIKRFEMLIEFLASNANYQYLTDSICLYFSIKSIDELRNHIKYLFAQLFILKNKNSYKFNVTDNESKMFLDT